MHRRFHFIRHSFTSYNTRKSALKWLVFGVRKAYLCSVVTKFIVISTTTLLLRVPSDRLMFISSEGNYSKVFTQDGHYHLVAYQLGQLEDIIGEQLGEEETPFIRIGKSLIVNRDFIYLIDVSEQVIIVSDCQGQFYELKASRKALTQIKVLIENTEL